MKLLYTLFTNHNDNFSDLLFIVSLKNKQTRIETNEYKIDITKEETDNEKQLNYEHSQTDLKEKLNYLECEKKRLFESKLSLIK